MLLKISKNNSLFCKDEQDYQNMPLRFIQSEEISTHNNMQTTPIPSKNERKTPYSYSKLFFLSVI
jgi:hypothetical protein